MKKRIAISKSVSNTGALDFSYLLDAPAGKHGFVTVKNGHLRYEDGTRARFVGFNFPARAAVPDHRTADALAARLASLGANVVRIHAADTPPAKEGWTMPPGFSLIDYDRGNTQELNSAGLERLDYWISALKARGIYIHMDLLVGRQFLEGDGLGHPGGLRFTKFAGHVDRRLIELQKIYAEKLLTHINPYTGLALKDDPAVMCVQITNEDSAFFSSAITRGAGERAYYEEELKERFNRFLLSKYGDREALKEAWTYTPRDGAASEGVPEAVPDGGEAVPEAVPGGAALCALRDDEDPAAGTVRAIHIGEYCQPMNEPTGDWTAEESPARYADYCEFMIGVNRDYYREMAGFLRQLGVRAPINTSNLPTGAADLYAHTDGEIMENNAYFNHPCGGPDQRSYIYAPYMREYCATDPRKAFFPEMEPRSHILTQMAPTRVAGKPFIMSEWNEYGTYPFHASAFLQTAACACFQGWDGLIIYNFHTSENLTDEAEDEIQDIMDAFNDPSLITQFGTMAAVFLKGLVRKAEHRVDMVYTAEDLLTQPEAHRMPYTYLPFVTGVRTVFAGTGETPAGGAGSVPEDEAEIARPGGADSVPENETESVPERLGTVYAGDADAAVTAGFVSAADLTAARHGILFSHSPWRDAFRREYAGAAYYDQYRGRALRAADEFPDAADLSGPGPDAGGPEETPAPGVCLGPRFLTIEDLGASGALKAPDASCPGTRDARGIPSPDASGFAALADRALKRWGILPESAGIDGRNAMISDTGELRFSPEEGNYAYRAKESAFFAGRTGDGKTVLLSREEKPDALSGHGKPDALTGEGRSFAIRIDNPHAAVSLLSLDGRPLGESRRLLLNAIGESGMDGRTYERMPDGPEYTEREVTRVRKAGKLFMETVEGELVITAAGAAPGGGVKAGGGTPDKGAPGGGVSGADRPGGGVRVFALDLYGVRIGELPVFRGPEGEVRVPLAGEFYANYEIMIGGDNA